MIVPVVMMVEGVHSGSRGALLHTTEELRNSARQWENMPVVIDHPERNGQYISAHEDGVHTIGVVRDAKVEDGKLKAEAWLDERRTQAASTIAYSYIRENKPLEVSIGIFTVEEEIEGEWNGEQYSAIARNHQPDHLALLPEDRGACSWEDGCGIRLNKETLSQKNVNEMQTNNNENYDVMSKEMITAVNKLLESGFDLQANDQGYQQLMSQIQQKLDGMDNDMRVHYLQEVYDEHVIYRVSKRDEGGSKLYQQSYSVNDNEQVEFSGDPVEVRQEVSYVPVTNKKRVRKPNHNKENKFINKKEEVIEMSTEKNTPCANKKAKVDELINCKLTNFTEEQREWLMEQEDSTLDLFKVNQPEVNSEEGTEQDQPKQVTKEEAIQALKEEGGIKDTEEYLSILPNDVQESTRSALRLQKQHRSRLVDSIVNHSKDVWSKEDLESESTEKLEKIAKTIEVNTGEDYSGNGSYEEPTTHSESEEEPLYPVGVEFENK